MTTWKPAWQGVITGGDAWEAIVSPGDEGWTWDAECFHRFGSGRAPTEVEAKAAALAWIADTLREVPTRAAVALAEIGENAPTSPDSASESATLPETPSAVTERPVGLVWHEGGYGWVSDDHYVWSAWATAPTQRICDWRWGVKVYAGGNAILIGGDTVESLEAAKAAAEACLRTWVARLNASLGGA